MSSTPPPPSRQGFRLPRILLVDDDPHVLRALRRVLLSARFDWTIDTAESAQAALLRVESEVYDVVVTDLQMPIVDGVTLLERLKAEHPNVMRLLHSSHVEPLERGQDLAHAVLAKPGRPGELAAALEWALAQRRKLLRNSVGY